MTNRIKIDEKYQAFQLSTECMALLIDEGEDPKRASMAQHQIALEAFMIFAAEILLCSDDQGKIRSCVGNAIRLICGNEFCEYYAKRERVLNAFPFLREGDPV
ncbi:hypothetical protein [Acetobacter sp.]|uniref:hypothetical protein n=1 Tax=Acetobacter sp. TaxID=440 RepID=UPI0039E8E333